MTITILTIKSYAGDIRIDFIIEHPDNVDFESIASDIQKEMKVYDVITDYANKIYYDKGGTMLSCGDANPWRITKEHIILIVEYFTKKHGSKCSIIDHCKDWTILI